MKYSDCLVSQKPRKAFIISRFLVCFLGVLQTKYILFIDACTRVNLRCGNRAVTEHLLNMSDVNIRFKQVSGKRMADHMWWNMNRNACFIRVSIYHIPNGLFRKPVAQPVDEEIVVIIKFKPKFFAIFVQKIFNIFISNLNQSFF